MKRTSKWIISILALSLLAGCEAPALTDTAKNTTEAATGELYVSDGLDAYMKEHPDDAVPSGTAPETTEEAADALLADDDVADGESENGAEAGEPEDGAEAPDARETAGTTGEKKELVIPKLTYEARDDRVVAITTVTVRNLPSVEADAVMSLKEGESIHRVGYHAEWTKVEKDGFYYYIATKYLKKK